MNFSPGLQQKMSVFSSHTLKRIFRTIEISQAKEMTKKPKLLKKVVIKYSLQIPMYSKKNLTNLRNKVLPP